MANGGNTPQTAIQVPNGFNAGQAHDWELAYIATNYSGYTISSEDSNSTSTPNVYLHHYVLQSADSKTINVYFLWDDNDHAKDAST